MYYTWSEQLAVTNSGRKAFSKAWQPIWIPNPLGRMSSCVQMCAFVQNQVEEDSSLARRPKMVALILPPENRCCSVGEVCSGWSGIGRRIKVTGTSEQTVSVFRPPVRWSQSSRKKSTESLFYRCQCMVGLHSKCQMVNECQAGNFHNLSSWV